MIILSFGTLLVIEIYKCPVTTKEYKIYCQFHFYLDRVRYDLLIITMQGLCAVWTLYTSTSVVGHKEIKYTITKLYSTKSDTGIHTLAMSDEIDI